MTLLVCPPYVAISAKLDVHPDANGTAVQIGVTVTNQAPVREAGYILGRFQGDYPGIFAVDVPAYAEDTKLVGVDSFVAAGSEGNANVLAGSTQIGRGQTKTYTVTFRLPPGITSLDVAASGRYPGIQWTFGDQRWSSGAGRHVAW